MLIALTRPVSPTLAECELTHLVREPIDLAVAGEQHAAYERTLAGLGAEVVRVAGAPELPDAVFIEDTAIVLDEVAVISRPGALARRPETGPVARALAAYRPLLFIEAPATLDGGDVLRVDRTLYVGLSSRTTGNAVNQLRDKLGPLGYRVTGVALQNCLHLKSAVTCVAEDTLLLNPLWVSPREFPGLDSICVAPAEAAGANALRLNDAVVYPAHLPRTAERLEQHGLRVVPVACDELAKAEGGVTCCSLLLHSGGASNR